MPARVQIPLRLVVDPASLADHAALDDAVRASVMRAVAHAHAEVVAPRGRFARVHRHAPDVRWHGAGLDRTSARARSAAERVIARAIERAAADAARPGADGTDAPSAPLRSAPAERVDPTRYSPAVAVYGLPSYQQQGRLLKLPVTGTPDRVERFGSTGGTWPALTEETWYPAFLAKLAERGIALPIAGHLGAIFELAGTGPVIVVLRYPGAEEVADIALTDLTHVEFDAAAGRWVQLPVLLPAGGAYRMSWAGTAEDAEAAFAQFYPPVVRAIARRERGPTISDAEVEERVADRVAAIVADELAHMTGMRSLFELEIDGGAYLVKTDADVPDDLRDVMLVPIADAAPAPEAGAAAAPAAPVAPELGGFIEAEPGAPAGEEAFPPGALPELRCEPFRGEPPIDALGAAGVPMRELVERIAHLLQMPACGFAGTFLLNAAKVLGSRAGDIGTWRTEEVAATRPAPMGDGNLGTLNITATPSPQLQLLRHLASVVPVISELYLLVERAVPSTDWRLRFAPRIIDGMGYGVGEVFAAACQVVFLQLLNASRDAIRARLEIIDGYAAHFERVLLPQLRTLNELLRMHAVLSDAKRAATLLQYNHPDAKQFFPDVRLETRMSPVSKPVAKQASWAGAAATFVATLQGAPPEPPPPRATHLLLIRQSDRTYAIQDRDGHVWTRDELDTAILLRRGTIESVDPLVKQMVDLPGVLVQLSRPGVTVKDELQRLLEEMRDENWHVYVSALGTRRAGVRASGMARTVGGTALSGWALRGIHEEAHRQIGEFFRGDRFYRVGIDHLLAAEAGKAGLAGFGELVGTVLLSVLCPPLAIEVGIALAAYHLHEAVEKRTVYRALIDPELARSYAEIEAELFAAELGLALSLLPLGIEAFAEIRAAASATARGGARAGEAAAGRLPGSSAGRVGEHLAEVIERGFVTMFARELVDAQILNTAIGFAMTPLLESMQRESAIVHTPGGAERALETVLQRLRERRATRKAAP
jgi:hypothetical protein